MRVLILSQFFTPEPAHKGISLAKGLRDRGHDVEVLTGFPNYPVGKVYSGYRIRPWTHEIMDGIRVNRTALYPSHNARAVSRICNYLSFGSTAAVFGPWLVKKPDVIYVYNLITLGTAARIMRLFRGSKILLDVQDLWPESVTSSGMLKNRALQWCLRRWCRREYASPDKLVAQSPGFKKELTARGVPESNIEVLYNWCDELHMVMPEPDEQTAQTLGFANRFNIVFAGNMGIMQNLDVVIECARRIADTAPDILFTLVGGGVDVDRLKGLAKGLHNVQFLEPRPRSEIGEILALADVLLVHLKDDPLFRITIPSKIQAYLYAGKPILCGVQGDATDLVQRAGAGNTFAPGNVDSLMDAVLKMRSADSTTLEAMGRAGHCFYREQLSLDVGVHKFEEIFLHLLEQDQPMH